VFFYAYLSVIRQKADAMTSTRSWRAMLTAYFQPKMVAMMALGFASGLPFMMYFSKLSRWLADVEIDKATIGFFYWIGLSYGLKFLWAPIVDRAKIPLLTQWLGQRRSWMFVAILGTIIGMGVISLGNPSPDVAGSLTIMIVGAFILTYSGATLDIAVDAWRIESGDNDEQASLAAVYQLGYRFAIMAAGFAMVFADMISWNFTYRLTAGLMAVVLLVVLFVKEPVADARNVKSHSFKSAIDDYVKRPFSTFVSRFNIWVIPVILLVCLYRLSDFTMGVMTQPLYQELGFTKTTVGLITGTFGPWPLIAGAFISGLFCVRIGLMATLMIGAILTILTNGAFAWLAMQTDASGLNLTIAIVSDNMAAGFVGTVFIAYMSSLVDRRYAATQYALLSSGYALFCKILAGFSGVLYEAVGAVKFFGITAAYGLPAIALIIFIWKFGPDNARGITAPAQESKFE
jgi:PAT family beta-lactamase induction signal transducer AmpG